ncbi:MAG TPA: Ig-like domain-containing protein [Gemmatimonadales bacterium]|nr:Ig-like domain-containing protein [Gemmatimonadales bacterium]
MTRLGLGLATAAVAALLGVSACSGDGVTLPSEGAPAGITIVDGDAQAGPAGSALADALVVEVTDSRGRPVADQEVTFTILTGDGEVAPTSDDTDADGLASVSWTLGPPAGAQRVRAQVTGNGAPEDLAVEFTATALAGSGSTLVLVSGDNQDGAVGAALAEPLVVRVVDPLGNPVSGQTVTWSVSGGGSIDPASSVTGEDGEASAQRTLGPSAGQQTAQATADGLAGSPVTFTHTAGASAPTRLVLVSGNNQSAPAGFALPDSLVVRLLDANDNGVPGRTITWVVDPGAGVAAPANTQTDAQGFAVTRWTLGPSVGSYTLNAVFSGLTAVPFAATATADAPTTIAILSGDGQSAAAGTTLPGPLRVKITDANGNPVENVSVTWAAVGGGSISSTTTGSDAQGIAQVTRTLGPTPGTYTTTASVNGLNGSPVQFTSTATVGAPARLVFLSQPASAVVGQPLSFQVEVQDAQGNRVTTATNAVAISSSVSGTLNGDLNESAAAGVATFDALFLDEARTGYRLTARSSGLAEATSDPFDIGPGATTVAITGRSPGGAVVTGQSVTFSFNVDAVAPASGPLRGSVTVSDGTSTNTCGTNDAGVGTCSIPLTTAGLHTVTATYVDDPNFGESTSAGFAVTVNKANSTVVISGDDPEPSVVNTPVTVSVAVSGNGAGAVPTGTVSIAASGTESCVAGLDAEGEGSCQLTLTTTGNRTLTATYAGDDNYNGDTDTESHAVSPENTAPDARDDDYAVSEDQTLTIGAPVGVLANDVDEGPLTASLVTGPSNAAAFTLNADGSFSYTPNPDFFGTDQFVYEASDGALTEQATVTITVTGANDPPSFTAGPNQVVSSTLTFLLGVTVPNWAQNIAAGPLGEPGTVTFQVSTDNEAVFTTPPAVSSDGTLTFQPILLGTPVDVNVTVEAQDEVGATSAAQAFTITINP